MSYRYFFLLLSVFDSYLSGRVGDMGVAALNDPHFQAFSRVVALIFSL
jgi:hypothetical protein